MTKAEAVARVERGEALVERGALQRIGGFDRFTGIYERAIGSVLDAGMAPRVAGARFSVLHDCLDLECAPRLDALLFVHAPKVHAVAEGEDRHEVRIRVVSK
ncbi:MAG: hypothetical protein V2J24_10865 [Pseudomonadales bacterium]|nr:hypothetical protein [Pseudomonadales bacterium]